MSFQHEMIHAYLFVTDNNKVSRKDIQVGRGLEVMVFNATFNNISYFIFLYRDGSKWEEMFYSFNTNECMAVIFWFYIQFVMFYIMYILILICF